MPQFCNNRGSSGNICLGSAPTRGSNDLRSSAISSSPANLQFSDDQHHRHAQLPHLRHSSAALRHRPDTPAQLQRRDFFFFDQPPPHCSALLRRPAQLCATVPHTSDAELPPSRTPPTFQGIVSSQHRTAAASSSSSTNHHRRCTFEESCTATGATTCLFFEQPSPTATTILFSLPPPPLHAARGGSSGAVAIASIQSPAPWNMPQFCNNRGSSGNICLGSAPTRGSNDLRSSAISSSPANLQFSDDQHHRHAQLPHLRHSSAALRHRPDTPAQLQRRDFFFFDQPPPHCSALLRRPAQLCATVPHTSDAELPPSRTPPTFQGIVSSQHRTAAASSSSSTNHHRRCTFEESCTATGATTCLFFEQPSPTATTILFSLPPPPLHAARGGSSGAVAIASIQSPAPWYVYFYDLDYFWIRWI
ncbi:hypothetical protein DEO72_LG10g3234 [Vigna unguiculata]|uniref:Uncharacterized protein n=1 Tax=Vigna unguiculata TaxID=3917 RepID=A0A4D6NIN5_VIGUN|nr:hypothetical protein DEO72_LG10g3234 [Vigna unguiculata]